MNEQHTRALTLRNIAEFERTSGLQMPQISAVAFTPEITYVATSNGKSSSFREGVTRENLAQLAGSISLQQHPGGTAAFTELKQWYEVLSDLASYPSYFEDLYPRLKPNVVQRFSDCVIFSFINDERIVQYQYKFDPDHQFPLALPDEVRHSFSGNYAAGPFLVRV